MAQNVTVEQMAKILEALAPEVAAAFRSGKGAADRGRVLFTEDEKAYYPEELVKLAEAVCPEWSSDAFRPRAWLRGAITATRKLREAHPETALAFLLRKGVQTIANDWYIVTPREWQDYCLVAQSNAVAEFYAPLYGSQAAGEVPRGERFPEGRITGENSVVVNHKFGLIEAFDRELFDDDQTGQIRMRAQRLGQSMAVTENAYAALRFIGEAGTYGTNLSVKASAYTTTATDGASRGVWSQTLYGTYGNKPTSFAALSLNGLKQAYTELMVAKDPLGNKLVINPNTLLVSAWDALHAPMLVAPPAGVPYYPAIVGPSGSTMASAPSGYPGGVFGANPFMGLGIKVVVSRYLNDWAWAFGEAKKGLIWQERDALEVIQENPAAGAAFEVDGYRFRSRRRFEVEWIGGGSRFWWLGNSGTGITVDGDAGATGSF